MQMQDARAIEKNARLMMLEGTLFWASLSFLQGDTVITNFIRLTTGSVALAGLAATIKTLLSLVGLFVAGLFIHRMRSQSRFMGILALISRPMFLILVPLILSGLSGPAAAWVFLLMYGLFFLTDGMMSLCWMEICARTLPIARRGEVMTLQQAFAGLVGLVAGWALKVILGSQLSFQSQYALIFGLAGVLLTIDGFALSRIRDLPHPCEPDRPVVNPFRYAARLIPILKTNRPVRVTLIARALYMMTLIAAPLNLMFGREAGLSQAQLATLVFMPVAGQIIAGVGWTQVCRRLSYPVMMLMAEALGVVSALINIGCWFLARAGLPVMAPLSLAMALTAVNMPANVGFFQHMIAEADPDRRPDTIVLAALVMAPLSLGTYLAGVVVERAGYLPVYLIMLTAGTVGLVLVRRLIAVTAK